MLNDLPDITGAEWFAGCQEYRCAGCDSEEELEGWALRDGVLLCEHCMSLAALAVIAEREDRPMPPPSEPVRPPLIARALDRAEHAYTLHMDSMSHTDGAYPDIFHDYCTDVWALVEIIDRLVKDVEACGERRSE